MEKYQYRKLDEVCKFLNGGTPSKENSDYFNGDIPWITGADITSFLVRKVRSFITEKGVKDSATNLVPAGTVLLVTRTSVGKVAVAGMPLCFSQDITAIRNDEKQLDKNFLIYFLKTKELYFKQSARGATIGGITREIVSQVEIPLPSLDEQKRIAAILDKADRLRRQRRFAQTLSDSFLQSIFIKMFGDLQKENSWKWDNLGSQSKIASGVTKGQNFNGKRTVFVPYLRVANVQDGYLDLSEIKMIEALETEAESLKLQQGDILMTEGGDYDKLGRGTIWNEKVENCIHQNHIFRVRLNQESLIPKFFDIFLRSRFTKSYFLRCAKQTTNLATINMTQLKELPVPLVPFHYKKNLLKSSKKLSASASNSAKPHAKPNTFFKLYSIVLFAANCSFYESNL